MRKANLVLIAGAAIAALAFAVWDADAENLPVDSVATTDGPAPLGPRLGSATIEAGIED